MIRSLQWCLLGAVTAALLASCTTRIGGGAPDVTSAARSGPATVTAPPSHAPTVTRTVTAPPPAVTVVVTPSPPATTPPLSSLLSRVLAGERVNPEAYFGAHSNAWFVTPSQNIGCYVWADGRDGVTCYILRYNFDSPDGRDCSYGVELDLDAGGARQGGCMSSSYEFLGGGRILPYGRTLINGDYGCRSESSGLMCVDLISEQGFVLNRDSFAPDA